MKTNVESIDIEKSTRKIFKYKKYASKGSLSIRILENGKNVDLSNYVAKVFFKFSNDIISLPCSIDGNTIAIPLKEEYFTKKGKVPFEITLESDEQRVTTFMMYLDV